MFGLALKTQQPGEEELTFHRAEAVCTVTAAAAAAAAGRAGHQPQGTLAGSPQGGPGTEKQCTWAHELILSALVSDRQADSLRPTQIPFDFSGLLCSGTKSSLEA